jgi:hypothetical protein
MADELAYCQTSDIAEIASAIRSKSGKVVKMKLSDMPAEVDALESVGVCPGEVTVYQPVSVGYGTIEETYTTYLTAPSNFSPIISYGNNSTTISGYKYAARGYAPFSGKITTDGDGNVAVVVMWFEKMIFKDLTFQFEKFGSFDGVSTTAGSSVNRTLEFVNCKPATTSMAKFLYKFPYTIGVDFSQFDSSSITDMTDFMAYANNAGGSVITHFKLSENWASNDAINHLNFSNTVFNHDCCLELFNKVATKTTSSVITLNSTTKSSMLASEIKIATDKNWTVIS